MVKSLTFCIILSGILIAQVVCARPSNTKKPAKPAMHWLEADVAKTDVQEIKSQEDNGIVNQKEEDEESTDQDEESEEDKDDEDEEIEDATDDEVSSRPFLTCTLFHNNFACNAMCSIFGSMYGIPITSGVCGDGLECECEISPNSTLEDYWNEKFIAKNTLQEILRNDKFSEKVFKLLKSPFKSPPQILEELAQILSPKQLSSIRFKNKSAQNIFPTTNDGEFDNSAIQKYVANKLKSLKNPPEGFDYKKTLLAVLNNPDNKDIIDYIITEIRQSKNRLLNGFVDGYVKERGLQIQQLIIDSKGLDNIVDILDTVVINNLIKQLPRENVLKLTEERTKPRKPAANSLTVRKM